MNRTREIAARLLAAVQVETLTAEDRGQVAAAMRLALLRVDERRAAATALDEIAEHLVCAREHLDLLRDVMMSPRLG